MCFVLFFFPLLIPKDYTKTARSKAITPGRYKINIVLLNNLGIFITVFGVTIIIILKSFHLYFAN